MKTTTKPLTLRKNGRYTPARKGDRWDIRPNTLLTDEQIAKIDSQHVSAVTHTWNWSAGQDGELASKVQTDRCYTSYEEAEEKLRELAELHDKNVSYHQLGGTNEPAERTIQRVG